MLKIPYKIKAILFSIVFFLFLLCIDIILWCVGIIETGGILMAVSILGLLITGCMLAILLLVNKKK